MLIKIDSSHCQFNHILLLPSNSIRSFDFVNDPNGVKISQSCNGLFLCSSSCFTLDYSDTRYYVLNPTTKYFSTIPRPTNGVDRNFVVSMNLAFDPSVSFHYKLVALRSKRWCGPDFQTAIYSSQTRTWTFSEVSYAYSTRVVFENGVFLNGKIHWPSCQSVRSIYYDVNQDRLFPLPMPHRLLTKDLLYFAESGGRLQLIEFIKNCSRHFYVFELETDYSKWFVQYRVDLKLAVSAFPEMYREHADHPCMGYTFNVLCFLGGDVEGDSCLV
ncbi:F-box protein At5g07610-like [Camellia sinensis]|uniref:F-box protein At5g07610-like n=1 Tax=Camellia sinensis TaxID=4442 RepID=UPI001036AB4F|nr:F-box protein At5g07610-like [Camellia sinensis]